MMSNSLRARAWVDVDLDALRRNYQTIADRSRTSVIPMVKADGYGLGAITVARALEEKNPLAFGVAAAEEGAALRKAGITRPILVFTPLSDEGFATAAANDLTPAISSLQGLEKWAGLGAGGFHLEIDTGMGRAGFDWREASIWGDEVMRRSGGQELLGVYTHFHSADSADPAPTELQWQRFNDALQQLPFSRENLVVHACNSAAALRWPEYALDAVRPGIFLYGGMKEAEPVASLRARVVLVKDVPPASTLGYAATHVARGWEKWATLGIGYGDGLRRSLGNVGYAIIRGRKVRIIGRISMDMTVVDVSGLSEIQPGDVATLIGAEGEQEILVEEVAAQVGTISYEILTGMTPRVPRLSE